MLPFTLSSVVDEVARQESLVGVFLGVMGLVFIIMGIRMSRLLVALSFGVVGFVLGACLAGPTPSRVALGLVAGVTLCGVSLCTKRPAVAVLAGLWAAMVAMVFLDQLRAGTEVTLLAAAAVFIGAASLAFVSFSEMTALVTSLEGTLLFLGGLMILCNQQSSIWSHLRDLLVSNPIFAPFLLIAGTVAGFYTQMAELQKKQTGQSA
jgi:hypothetical protein